MRPLAGGNIVTLDFHRDDASSELALAAVALAKLSHDSPLQTMTLILLFVNGYLCQAMP